MEEISQENKDKIKAVTEKSFNPADVPVEEPTSFDYTRFEGQRVPIKTIEMKAVIDLYSDGDYNKDSTDYKWVVEITTGAIHDVVQDTDGKWEVLAELVKFTDEDGSERNLSARHRFNLQQQMQDGKPVMVKTKIVNEQGEEQEIAIYKPKISKHEKASFWKFCRKMGAKGNTFEEIKKQLLNKLVTITTVPSKKEGDDRRFLAIVV